MSGSFAPPDNPKLLLAVRRETALALAIGSNNVLFDDVRFDAGVWKYSPSSIYEFTAPETGIYNVQLAVGVSSTGGTTAEYYTQLMVNNTALNGRFDVNYLSASTSVYGNHVCHTTIPALLLNKGNTLRPLVNLKNLTGTLTAMANLTSMTVYQLF